MLNLIAILLVWFFLASLITLVPGATNSVMVAPANRQLAYDLPDDVSIMRWENGMALLYSERPGFVADLYRSGAALVLPARKSGCLDLRKKAA
jgi:hypothetical protein